MKLIKQFAIPWSGINQRTRQIGKEWETDAVSKSLKHRRKPEPSAEAPK